MTLQFAAIVAANASNLFQTLLPGVAASLFAFGAATWLASGSKTTSTLTGARRSRHPLDWRTLLAQAGTLFAILSLTTLASRGLGDRGLWSSTFLGGLFELHGVTFAITNSAAAGHAAVTALNLAFVAALVSKIALLMVVPRPWKDRSKLLLAAALIVAGSLFVAGSHSGFLLSDSDEGSAERQTESGEPL
jgi:uncharacterized membrane protein (DUF4010 family)